jgi:hypothetical protein
MEKSCIESSILQPAPASSLLSSLPPNLSDLRTRLFHAEDKIQLSVEEFETSWPYLDNMFVRNKTRKAANGTETVYWYCRLWQKKDHVSKVPAGKQQRNKNSRDAGRCPCIIKMVKNDSFVVFKRTSKEGHNHDYDAIKHKNSSGVRTMLGTEIEKGYLPNQVRRNLCNARNGNREALYEAGGNHIDRHAAYNAGLAYLEKHPDSRLAKNEPYQVQVNDLRQFLQAKDWMVQDLEVNESHSVAFSYHEGIQNLTRRGHLTLMDSTHKTNKLGWYLTSLMVRNECSSWIPTAFFLHDKQDSDIIAASLRQIKRWCGNRWLLRYMLTDDSAGEQAAVKKAFPGLEVGEMEVTHLLCTVHSERTLQRHFGSEAKRPILKHLTTALYIRKTKAGCHDSIDAAIKACSQSKDKDYIEKEWRKTAPSWAMYARQHSSLLLQVRTTNPIESWHHSLKHAVKKDMPKWSLRGIADRIVEKVLEWMERAREKEGDFRTKYVTDFAELPMLRRFPYPVQQLILKELRVLEDEEDGDLVPLSNVGDETLCTCLFYRKWQLPCRHILKQEKLFGGILTDEYWYNWHRKWEESGFELYEGMTPNYMTSADNEIGAPVRRKLEVREVLDSLLNRYYELEASTVVWPADIQDEAIRSWTKALDVITGSLRKEAVGVLKKRLCGESQQVLETSQTALQQPAMPVLEYYDFEEMEG